MTNDPTPRPRAFFAAIAWIVFLGLYVLFAGQASWAEATAGLPAAAFATVLAVAVHSGERRSFRLAAPWHRLAGRCLASLAMDTFRVGRVLLATLARRPAGQAGDLSRQPFDHGGGEPRAAGRRALVTLGASVAPNGYVISIGGDEDAILLHRLAPVPPDPDRRWPL